MSNLRSIFELTTEEAYEYAVRLGHELPELDAVLNEDWGRDYILQRLQQHDTAELANIGLTWEREADS